MAEGDGVIFNSFKGGLLGGGFDLANDTLKISLVAAYTPDIDADTAWTTTTDPGSLEFAATGNYAAATVAGNSVSTDTSNNHGAFDANDITWSSLNLGASSASPSHAVLWDDTHASDALICYWEVTTASNGGNYTLQFNAAGLITLS